LGRNIAEAVLESGDRLGPRPLEKVLKTIFM
jgi:hypothetical protein